MNLVPLKRGEALDIRGGPYGSLVQDPQGGGKIFASGGGGVTLFESDDLETWKPYGMVIPKGYEGCIFWDPNINQYRAVFSIRGQGIMTSASPDGREWRTWQGPWLERACDSNGCALFDEALDKYVLYLRAWKKRGSEWFRIVVRAAVPAFSHLLGYNPEPEDGDSPFQDKEELQPIKKIGWPFTVAADIPSPFSDWYTWPAIKIDGEYFAFPSIYDHDHEDDHPLHEGTTEILAAHSVNGMIWNLQENPYVGRGPTDAKDCGCLYLYNGFLERDGQILQVYYGNNRTHTKLKVLSSNRSDTVHMLGVLEISRAALWTR